MTWQPKYTITKEILFNLTRIEQVRETFENKPLSPVLLNSLHNTAKVSSVHYSTKIEGNRLSMEQVERTLHTMAKKAATYHQRDEKEVKAYYDALNYMEKYLEEQGTFTETFIQKIHALIEGQKKIIPYRETQNAIYDSVSGALVYLPPEAKDVPMFMKEMVAWVKENIDTLPTPVVAGLVHYQFVTIHPYFDGNGRTARLITSFLMRKFGYGLKGIYSLEEYYAKDLSSYYAALATHPHHNYYEGRHESDLTGWLKYFIKGVAESFEKVSIKAEEEIKKGFTVDKSPLLRELDIKQRKALELFVEYKEITSGQLAGYMGISEQSARILLRKWIAEGFLQVANQAKKNRTYTLSEKYEDLVK